MLCNAHTTKVNLAAFRIRYMEPDEIARVHSNTVWDIQLVCKPCNLVVYGGK